MTFDIFIHYSSSVCVLLLIHIVIKVHSIVIVFDSDRHICASQDVKNELYLCLAADFLWSLLFDLRLELSGKREITLDDA